MKFVVMMSLDFPSKIHILSESIDPLRMIFFFHVIYLFSFYVLPPSVPIFPGFFALFPVVMYFFYDVNLCLDMWQL